MKYALNLSNDNRILSATFSKYAGENATLVDNLPDGNITDYLYQDGEYVYSPIPVEENKNEKIAELKTKLSSTDYKIIKCSEAQLVGEELPYDIKALHEERQALRDEINALEGSVE